MSWKHRSVNLIFAFAICILTLLIVPLFVMAECTQFHLQIKGVSQNIIFDGNQCRPLPNNTFDKFFLSSVMLISKNSSGSIVLYEHKNFHGKSILVTRDISNLHQKGWGDKVSSFRILRGYWILYVHINYQGHFVTLGPGNYQWIEDFRFPNDALSSLRTY